MKLYFNGCSFTYGDELKNPTTNAWPALLSDYYGYSFVNDAVSGGTNDRMVHNTMLNINNYDKFYIAWTSYTRFTRYYYANSSEVNFNPSMNFNFSALLDSQLLKYNKSHYTKYAKLHYKYWNNEFYNIKTFLQQIILLQSFLTSHNKEFTMVNTFNNNLSIWLSPKDKFITALRPLITAFDGYSDEQLLEEYDNIQLLVNLIDTTKFIEWNKWHIASIVSTSNIPCGPNGHFLDEGHRIVMERIISHD